MLGAWSLPEPGSELAFDLLSVGLRVASAQILPHQLNTGIEKIERQAERSHGSRGGRHVTDCSASEDGRCSTHCLPLRADALLPH
jgi:hypothetical protein